MDENKFKQRLLDMIWNDNDVHNAICYVTGQETEKSNEEIDKLNEKIDRLTEENQRLQQELNNKDWECSEKRAEIDGLTKENQRLKQTLDNKDWECSEKRAKIDRLTKEKEECDKKISRLEIQSNMLTRENQKYKERYLKIDAVYDRFNGLNENIRSSFAQIVNYDTPLTFLTSGTEQENIRLYWEKVSMEYKKYDNETLDILNLVFDYLFEQFQRNHSGYRRIRTMTGEDFKLDMHTRTPDSLPSGKVKKVIIDGYMNDNGTKKVKSFVEIG